MSVEMPEPVKVRPCPSEIFTTASPMESSPAVAELGASGRLKVVDIFIDREVDQWKARVADYPAAWINGYDHTFTIRNDILYNVRAVPSMYLLDKDKRVIFKDVPPEILLTYLSMLG